MEAQIRTKRKKLVISFSGCSKDDTDKTDKYDSNSRIDTNKQALVTKNHDDQAKQLESQLAYKF